MAFFHIFRNFLELGGVAAWMIMLAGITLVVVGLERVNYLYFKASFDSVSALDSVRDFVLKREYTKALQLCNQNANNPELNVMKAGLISVENGREAMKSSVAGAILQVSRDCEVRLPFLALIASCSTLLGLFGTILGLIGTFAAMANADAGEKARLLGSGISEAMYSTAAGLIVGVAAMVIHTICISKTDLIVGKVQKGGLNLMTWIEQSERSKQVG